MRSIVLRFALWSLASAGFVACAPSTSVDESSASSTCESGLSRPCSCNGSLTQTCAGGQWSSCDCPGDTPASGGSGGTWDAGSSSGLASDASGAAPAGALPCAVQTVLRSECGACHGRDNQYPAPMKLETWDDLNAPTPSDPTRKVYDTLLSRVQDTTRPMPPSQFSEALSAEQIDTLKAWVDAGAKPAAAGEACTSSELPGAVDGGSGEPTKPMVDSTGSPDDCEEYFELRAHPEDDDSAPYQVPSGQGEGANRYQCFYFSPEYAPDSQGLWFKSLIDNQKIMHHWLLYASDLDAVHAPGSQSPCTAAEPGAYLIAGWAPGAPDYTPPADVGLALPSGPDSRLILEIHWFNDSGSVQPDQSGVRFCTAKKDTRPHTAGVHFTGSEGICVQPQSTQDVVGMCDPDDGQDIHLMRIWPHMHTLGRRMTITLLRADGSSEVLHDKPFDFYNQQAYDLNDVVMHSGDRLQTVCSFQNRTNAAVPFGEDTQDEMCYGFITAWPAGALVNSVLDVGTWVGGALQPARRCLDPLAILDSCNGLADYPPPGG